MGVHAHQAVAGAVFGVGQVQDIVKSAKNVGSPGFGAKHHPLWVHPHPQRAGAVAFSPDGRTCATADHGGNVACLARATGRVLVVTGGRDGSVRVWGLADGRPVGRVMFHADRVTQVAFGTGGLVGCLVTASVDRTVRVWDTCTGLPLGPPFRHPEAVLALAVSEDGRVLTGGKDGVLREWRPNIGRAPTR